MVVLPATPVSGDEVTDRVTPSTLPVAGRSTGLGAVVVVDFGPSWWSRSRTSSSTRRRSRGPPTTGRPSRAGGSGDECIGSAYRCPDPGPGLLRTPDQDVPGAPPAGGPGTAPPGLPGAGGPGSVDGRPLHGVAVSHRPTCRTPCEDRLGGVGRVHPLPGWPTSFVGPSGTVGGGTHPTRSGALRTQPDRSHRHAVAFVLCAALLVAPLVALHGSGDASATPDRPVAGSAAAPGHPPDVRRTAPGAGDHRRGPGATGHRHDAAARHHDDVDRAAHHDHDHDDSTDDDHDDGTGGAGGGHRGGGDHRGTSRTTTIRPAGAPVRGCRSAPSCG